MNEWTGAVSTSVNILLDLNILLDCSSKSIPYCSSWLWTSIIFCFYLYTESHSCPCHLLMTNAGRPCPPLLLCLDTSEYLKHADNPLTLPFTLSLSKYQEGCWPKRKFSYKKPLKREWNSGFAFGVLSNAFCFLFFLSPLKWGRRGLNWIEGLFEGDLCLSDFLYVILSWISYHIIINNSSHFFGWVTSKK